MLSTLFIGFIITSLLLAVHYFFITKQGNLISTHRVMDLLKNIITKDDGEFDLPLGKLSRPGGGGGVGILRYIVTSAFLAFLGARNFIVSFSWVERFWQDFS